MQIELKCVVCNTQLIILKLDIDNVYTNYAEEVGQSLGNSIDLARSNLTDRRASLLARFMPNASTRSGWKGIESFFIYLCIYNFIMRVAEGLDRNRTWIGVAIKLGPDWRYGSRQGIVTREIPPCIDGQLYTPPWEVILIPMW